MSCWGGPQGLYSSSLSDQSATPYADCNSDYQVWVDTAANFSNYYSPQSDSDSAGLYPDGVSCVAYVAPENKHFPVGSPPDNCISNGWSVAMRTETYSFYLGADAPDYNSEPSTGDSDPVALTVEDLFNPQFVTTEQYQMIFSLFFSLPLIVYLVAWGYQTVINFATKDN